MSVKSMIAQDAREAAALFTGRFGRRPRWCAAAPGRVNLLGEHTDYNEGFVLPMAIDCHAMVLAAPAAGKISRLWSIDLDEMIEVDLRRPLSSMRGSAANYLLGVADQFARAGHRLVNIDVAVRSTVPIGAGLGSSAAVEVAFATLLEEVLDARLEPLEKALLCQRAEHEFPGVPCGIMDMYASALARAGHAMLIDCRSRTARHVPLPPAEQMMVLIADTGVKRALASVEYARRREACRRAAETLRVRALRDATPRMIAQADLTDEERRAALHVVGENARTVLAATALAEGDVNAFGELMFVGHDSLRDLFQVSCPELDVLVESARQPRGDDGGGARMTGAGFGGCVVITCRADSAHAVRAAMNSAFSAAFGRVPAIFPVRAAGSAAALALE